MLPPTGISISQMKKDSKKRSDALKQTNAKALTEPCAVGIYCRRADCSYAHTIDEFVSTECMKGDRCNKGISMTGCAFSHDAKKSDICIEKCDHRYICVRHHPHESPSSYHDRIKRLFGALSRPPHYPNAELPKFYTPPVRDKEDERIDAIRRVQPLNETIFHYINTNDIDGLKKLLLKAPYDLGDILTLTTKHQSDKIMKVALESTVDPSKWLAFFLLRFLSIPQQLQTPLLVVPLTGFGLKHGMMVADKELNLQKEWKCLETRRPPISKLSNILHRFSDYSKSLRRPEINDEWLKGWEMIHAFQLIPQQSQQPFRVCCSTTSFLSSIHHYIKTKTHLRYEWWCNSDVKDYLHRKYEKRWLPSKIDIVKPLDTVIKKTNHSIDLYTGDFTRYESPESFLHEIVYGLSVLSVGGSLICKIYFSPITIYILYLMSEMFNALVITKPLSSRPEDSELYIVGKGFKGYQECKKSIDILLSYYYFTDSYLDSKEQIPVDFYLNALYAFYLAYTRQLHQINNQAEIIEKIDMRNVRDIRDIRDIRTANEFRNRNEILMEWQKRFPIPPLRKEQSL
jgi:hypothetical protein